MKELKKCNQCDQPECQENPTCNSRMHKRIAYIYKWRKDKQAIRKQNHQCIECGKKVKPVTTWPIRCKEHQGRANDGSKRNKDRNHDTQ